MTQAAVPHPASTVVLVRPNESAFEVFMNRRPDHLDTYAGVYVFPGGRVEPGDWSEPMLNQIRGLSGDQARQALGCDLETAVCLGYWVAAVRELFEEAGIHFFIDQEGAPFRSGKAPLTGNLAEKRSALQNGKLQFAQMLAAEALFCDLGRLSYFFHRVTPEHYKTRFDTRFYLASLPSEQVPLEASEEVVESLWITPEDALQRHQDQRFLIMPPTVAVLRMLAEQRSWQALRDTYRLSY
jgi:8-oxo-dGTP pyrophosphatase MutT (NUDIX family)